MGRSRLDESTTRMDQKIGFVGVGRMGANMARRLKDVGYTIAVVQDVSKDRAKELAQELGCKAAASLAEVTAGSDIIFTVVSDDAAMKQVFGDGLLTDARGKLFINCATLTPQIHHWVQERCKSAGAQSLEACMASSIPQARNGQLYLMCGGNRDAFDRAKPMLEKLSASMRFIGPAGTAAQVKAIVNMVMNINTAGLAEGLGLGAALGLDVGLLREVLSQTGANSRVLQTDGEDMQNREHSCFFSAEHAAKDSAIALQLAREKGVQAPLAEATYNQYRKMVDLGLGQLDKSGIAELTFKDRMPSNRTSKISTASKP